MARTFLGSTPSRLATGCSPLRIFSISEGSILKEFGSISANTGIAPTLEIAPAVAKK